MDYYYKEMGIQGVKRNGLTRLTMLRIYTFNDDVEKAEAQFKKMERFFYQNNECYFLMFDMFWRQGKMDEALKYEKAMEDYGFIPTREMCDKILEYYAQQGDEEKVWTRYFKMRQLALKPRTKTKKILQKYGMGRFVNQDKFVAGQINFQANPGSYYPPFTMKRPHRAYHNIKAIKAMRARGEDNLFM